MDDPTSSEGANGGPLGNVAALIDGGDLDCGSGLLLLITRAMRRLKPGDLLGIRSADVSVVTDLPVWAKLVGHDLTIQNAETDSGPWWFAVRKAGSSAGLGTVFSQGSRTPVGDRLWAYTTSTATSRACTAAPSPLRGRMPAGWIPWSRRDCSQSSSHRGVASSS